MQLEAGFWKLVSVILGSESAKKLIAKYLVCAVIFYAIGAYSWPRLAKYVLDPTGTAKMANERMYSPTNRDEDLSAIREKLVEIDNEIKKLTSNIDTKLSANTIIVKCGINNEELNDWEISVSGKNTLDLKAGEDILLINSYTNQSQTAKFKVKFIRSDDMSAETKIFINLRAATYFGISNPERIGVFDLKIQRI